LLQYFNWGAAIYQYIKIKTYLYFIFLANNNKKIYIFYFGNIRTWSIYCNKNIIVLLCTALSVCNLPCNQVNEISNIGKLPYFVGYASPERLIFIACRFRIGRSRTLFAVQSSVGFLGLVESIIDSRCFLKASRPRLILYWAWLIEVNRRGARRCWQSRVFLRRLTFELFN
jgi:hypothetical protein